MNIKDLIDKYRVSSSSLRDAQNLAAEEIVLSKIATSEMTEHITLKGGIVMYNLARSDRRVTKDIDFDFIRYSIEKESINTFIKKMNSIDDGFHIALVGEQEELHQEDYRGVRIHVVISDSSRSKLRLKLDIGVHTYTAIDQEKLTFHFDSEGDGVMLKVNPPEQICAEKLLSLARLGVLSTRHKDLYDIYYLVQECGVSARKTSDILNLFFDNSQRRPRDMFELQASIDDVLNNDLFLAEAARPTARWIDIDINDLKRVILTFVNAL